MANNQTTKNWTVNNQSRLTEVENNWKAKELKIESLNDETMEQQIIKRKKTVKRRMTKRQKLKNGK